MRRRALVLALFSMVAACEGPAGPAGPTGPSGVPPGYLHVLDFGAKPDQASFDNTASFQHALDSAARLGGGVVWVPVGRFWFAGNLSIGANVVLAGADVGPYDPGNEDPVSISVAPTLLPTSVTGSAFISIGQSSALQDVLIIYPNQVAPNAPGVATTGPIPYPPTVLVLGSANVFRSALVNSYKGIDVETGRVILENLDWCLQERHHHRQRRGFRSDQSHHCPRILGRALDVAGIPAADRHMGRQQRRRAHVLPGGRPHDRGLQCLLAQHGHRAPRFSTGIGCGGRDRL